MQLLTFTLTGMDYGISLENVESIESKMNVVVVPTSPANIRGIIRLHGEILPVFSLASRFGLGNIAVDTRELIEASLKEIEEGNQAVERVSTSLEEVIDGIKQIAETSKRLSDNSKDQAEAMKQAE